MSMTDPVADLLARIRNAASAGQRRLELPASRLKVEVARILHDNHYITDYKVVEDGVRKLLRITLRYHNDRSVIRELKRMSTPGLRRYVKSREIPRIKNGLGIAIVSTPKGLMSDSQARAANLGGELLAVVW